MSPEINPAKASAARRAAWMRLCHPDALIEIVEDNKTSASEPDDRRDRALADRLVRGVLRHLRLIDVLINRPRLFHPYHTPDTHLWILRLAAYEKIFQAQSPDYAIGQQATALGRECGGPNGASFINAVIRRLLPTLPDSPEALQSDRLFCDSPPAVRWSVPDSVAGVLASGYGPEAFEPVLQALCEDESPTWLRVNRLRTDPATLAARLAEEGVEVSLDTPESDALRVTGGDRLPWVTQPWRDGECTIQDIGAMLATRLLNPQPGMAVLDACAAPGGKTGHIYERMEGRGRLVAVEVQPDRRQELPRTLQRLYGPEHGIEIPDLGDLAELEPGAGFDRVLVDAPCQALGLIRRHPEIRWDGRLKWQSAMVQTQRRLLDTAARQVSPEGQLLWVTCSPTRAENEQLVLEWLSQNVSWKILNLGDLVSESWRPFVLCDGPVLRTRPDRLACDGFAMCLLGRA